jgi:hypothetical protein
MEERNGLDLFLDLFDKVGVEVRPRNEVGFQPVM